jgi:Fe-S-cluster containining protein
LAGGVGVSDELVLRRHRLKHIPELKVSAEVLDVRFRTGCAMANCRGACCDGGADVDVAERDRILQHADLVRAHMDAGQDHTAENWFEDLTMDSDFPSGLAVTTRMHNDNCVFLNSAGLCVLQMAEADMRDGSTLKPFFCRAYPICLNDGVLTFDDQFESETGCCGAVADGGLTVFDVCADELAFVLGAEGAAELRALAEPVEAAHQKATS